MAAVLLLIFPMPGCESREQTVRIVAEDFRFTPAEVHISAEHPIRLLVVNGGREPHEFKSALLAHQIGSSREPSRSLPVLPNQNAETFVRTVPGVYVFYCAMRGHAGMSGTIIVD
jgi:plastocyanin